jgi:hypothetical protein
MITRRQGDTCFAYCRNQTAKWKVLPEHVSVILRQTDYYTILNKLHYIYFNAEPTE